MITLPRYAKFLRTLLLVIALTPNSGNALGIGDAVLLSNLGEPLYATMDMQLAPGEQLNDGCLSLFAVNENGNPADGTDQKIKLAYQYNPRTHNVEISSKLPFNEPFVMLRLQVKCQGIVGSRTLTLLPKIIDSAGAQPSKSIASAIAPRPANRATSRRTPDKSAAIPIGNASPLGLKWFGGELDLSRVGQLGAEEYDALFAQQKLLQADDPTAYFIATQQQLRLAQDEVDKLRLQLARAEVLKTTPLPAKTPLEDTLWRNVLFGLAAMLVLIAIIFGLRYFSNVRKVATVSRRKNRPTAQPERTVGMQKKNIVHPNEPRQATPFEDTKFEAAALHEIQAEKTQSKNDDRGVLEEAELYSVYGHADKGIRMLLEFVSKHPKSEKAWMLLFSIYASSGQAAEFEKAARAFLNIHQDSGSWKTIQALGRTLDKSNPMYAEAQGDADIWHANDLSEQHRIGDVLIELGYLSEQDMNNCLREFNPEKNGRFGNYLLTRRMINYAQLNEALLKQQTPSTIGVKFSEPSVPDKLAESLA